MQGDLLVRPYVGQINPMIPQTAEEKKDMRIVVEVEGRIFCCSSRRGFKRDFKVGRESFADGTC